jgi:cyclopropane-fatty-acyl-phospholipid synthase
MFFYGDLGLAESYMSGDWDTKDLAALLRLGNINSSALRQVYIKTWFARTLDRIRHAQRANTPSGSRRNIAAHYNLGNNFYDQWLDPTMSYSSALFNKKNEPMEFAQRRKYLRIAEKLELKSGQRVLEIGCGWGGFAEIAAAEFGCNVVGLTLSTEQAAFARSRMARLKLSKKVDIRLQDYRDVKGRFDKIVSIEMFEAVGEAYWSTYLEVLARCLKPGGQAALQIITIDNDRFTSYRNDPEFIQRYIFPGGMLPSPRALENALTLAKLKITNAFYFGSSYAETLRRWDKAFQAHWPEIKKLGFDERFYRMWRYYFCYCEVGFDEGIIDVGQFVIEQK